MATKLRIENGKWKINASFNRFRRAGHAGAASLALADNSPSDLIPPYNDNRHVFINGYRVNINRIPTITHIIGGLLGKTAGWGHPALQYTCYQSIKSVVTYTHFIVHFIVGCDDLGAPYLTGLYGLSRRGSTLCSRAAPYQTYLGRTMFAPTVMRVHVGDIRCAEVVPQGTFSCGIAAIHLAAPCRIPVRNDYTMRPFSRNAHTPRGMRILCTY